MEDRIPARSWAVLALLSALFALAGIDRSLISILAAPIKQTLGLSDTQLGLLTGLAFAIPYVIAGVPVGILIDRVHRIRASWLLVSLWSLATVCVALVTTYPLMLATRAWLGAAESGVAPTFSSLTSDLFPKTKRASAMALLYVSSPIGSTVGFLSGGLIAAAFGWQSAFLIFGAVGLALGCVLLLVKEPRRGRYDEDAASPGVQPIGVAALWRVFAARPKLWWLILAGSAVIAAQAGIGAFLALFMMSAHHMQIAQAGLTIGLAYGIGGIVGMPAGGYLADYVARRLPGREMLIAVATQLLTVVSAGVAFSSDNLTVALIGLWFYSVFCVAAYGITFASFADELPATLRGSGMAVLLIFQNLVGYGVGPGIAGALSDFFRRHHDALPLRPTLLWMSAIYVLGAIAYWGAYRSGSRAAEVA